MFIGTQYYRPPHPDRSDWERNLWNIAETGIGTACLGRPLPVTLAALDSTLFALRPKHQ
jgi:hypothetical protein